MSFEIVPVADAPLARGGRFDYDSLDAEKRKAVRKETADIRRIMQKSHADYIAVGHALIVVKERLEHGQWEARLDAEFGWSKATAKRYMQVAQTFPELAHPERFEPTALYKLSEGDTPDEVRERFVAKAEAGESVRIRDVRAVLKGLPEPTATKPKKPEIPWTTYEMAGEIGRMRGRFYGRLNRQVPEMAGVDSQAMWAKMRADLIEMVEMIDKHFAQDVAPAAD